MGRDSAIEWTNHTFNIAWGCIEVSDGCTNCYARTLASRYGVAWGVGAERRVLSDKYWAQPIAWDAAAAKSGVRARVFTSSMTDVFLNDATIDEQRERLWPLIRRTPNLDWQLLTKHPERFAGKMPADWGDGYPNVWLGVSVENDAVRWRIDALRKTSARVRFLSCEPLLAPLDLRGYLEGVHWAIVGGESGPKARPIDAEWVRVIREDCARAGVAFLFKQWGGVDKKSTGRTLDGQTYDGYPTVAIAAGMTETIIA